MVAIGADDYVAVALKIGLGDVIESRRKERHEVAAELLDGTVIDRREVPTLVFHNECGGCMGRATLGQDLCDQSRACVRPAVKQGCSRQEPPDVSGLELIRMDAKCSERLDQLCGVHNTQPEATRLSRGVRRSCIAVGDKHSAHRLGRVTRWPTDNVYSEPDVGGHCPERLGVPIRAGGRADAAAVQRRFCESEHSVLVRPASCGGRRPERRAHERWRRGKCPGHPSAEQTLKGRH